MKHLAVLFAILGCTAARPPTSPTGGPGAPTLALPSHDPAQNAAFLVDALARPADRLAAINTILTESGIPLISADGRLVNQPRAPLRTTYLYDFQVARMATEPRRSLDNLAGFAAWVGITMANGPPLPPAVLGFALNRWVARAQANRGTDGALAALVFGELGRRHATHEDWASSAFDDALLDDVQFTVAGAVELSSGPAAPTPSEIDIEVEGCRSMLDSLSRMATGPVPPELANNTFFQELLNGGSKYGLGPVVDHVSNGSTAVSTVRAALALYELLAGLGFFVQDDHDGLQHYNHDRVNTATFTAHVSFTPEDPGIVRCLVLAGASFPSRDVDGWFVRWKIEKPRHMIPAFGQIDQQTSGQRTVAGLSTFKVEMATEVGCSTNPIIEPSSGCGHGTLVTDPAPVTACLIPPDDPTWVQDMLGLNPLGASIDLLLSAVNKALGTCQTHEFTAEWHVPDLRIALDSTITVDTGAGPAVTHALGTAALALKPDYTLDHVRDATIAIDHFSLTLPGIPCTLQGGPGPAGRLLVSEASLAVDHSDPQAPRIEGMHLKLDPGVPPAPIAYSCTDPAGTTHTGSLAAGAFWIGGWRSLHLDEGTPDHSGYVVDSWVIADPSKVDGTRDYQRTGPTGCANACYDEATHLELSGGI